jgi:alpha-1,3-rhamnosyl/mannosyltransferase
MICTEHSQLADTMQGRTAKDLSGLREIAKHDVADIQLAINGISLLSPLTGIGQYTYHLINQFQALGMAPWIFYGTNWSREIRQQPVPGIARVKGLVKRFVPRPYIVSRLACSMRFALGLRRKAIQVYHEPNFLAYRFDGPTVVTVHDLSWVRYPETHPIERVREMNRLMPRTIERATQIVVDSEFVRHEVINHFGVSPDRVTTVLLGVTSAFRPCSKEECLPVLQARGLNYGKYILAVGTLEPRKNLASVVAAYRQLPEAVQKHYPLVIVGMRGWGDDEHFRALRQLTESGRAIMAGYVPQEELPLLYGGARMLVYPSLYEGFGLPPLEAMACGVPVVSSNRASLPEVVGDAGIQVEALNSRAIADAIHLLVEDNAEHGRLMAAGIERAKQFSWERCALETLGVYRKTIRATNTKD